MSKQEPTKPVDRFQIAESLFVEMIGLKPEVLNERLQSIKNSITGVSSDATISETTKKIIGTIVEAENFDAVPADFKKAVEETVNAAVTAKLAEERQLLEAAHAERVQKEISTLQEKSKATSRAVVVELIKGVDLYMKSCADKWLEENQVSIDEGIKSQVLENFYRNVVRVIKESGVNADLTPKVKEEVKEVKALAESKVKEIGELKRQLNEAKTEALSAQQKTLEERKKLTGVMKTRLFENATSGLSDMQKDKVKTLTEGVVFKTMEEYSVRISKLAETVRSAETPKPVVVNESLQSITTTQPVQQQVQPPVAPKSTLLESLNQDQLFG